MIDTTASTNPPEDEKVQQPEPQPAIIILHPSTNAMQLEMTLQKAGDDTIPPKFEDVMDLLAEKGITYGIDEGLIRVLCAKPVYFRPFVIAKGKQPKVGKDGYLNYLISTTREMKPNMREDGTVDYRDLGYIQNVYKDQELVEIYAPEKGKEGCNIFGMPIEGKLGRPAKNCAGKNTVTSEDGTRLLAACDGNVEVRKGVVEIHNVLRINGNVDNATGDIHFVGDIFVLGDVLAGFKVVTTNGSVTVKGSVEGATITATGDIVVGEGINGMNRGEINAGGSLKCRYIQSCYIKIGGSIYADSIMYCNTECGKDIELGGKRAALIGGRSAIAGRLQAKTIGTESHVATQIVMAASGVEKEQELKELEKQLKTIDSDSRKLLQIMARYEDLLKQGRLSAKQKGIILTVRENYMQLQEQRDETVKRHAQVKQEQLEAGQVNSMIECKGRVHVGVQFVFGPLTMNVHESFVNSRIFIKDYNISVSPL